MKRAALSSGQRVADLSQTLLLVGRVVVQIVPPVNGGEGLASGGRLGGELSLGQKGCLLDLKQGDGF
jgi:hypothetical protein